jgi:hypothetical protein
MKQPVHRLMTSSSVTVPSARPLASDRAIVLSPAVLTQPRRVTRPWSTMMWMGGFDRAA